MELNATLPPTRGYVYVEVFVNLQPEQASNYI